MRVEPVRCAVRVRPPPAKGRKQKSDAKAKICLELHDTGVGVERWYGLRAETSGGHRRRAG